MSRRFSDHPNIWLIMFLYLTMQVLNFYFPLRLLSFIYYMMIVDFEDLNNLFEECLIDFTKKQFSIIQCHN